MNSLHHDTVSLIFVVVFHLILVFVFVFLSVTIHTRNGPVILPVTTITNCICVYYSRLNTNKAHLYSLVVHYDETGRRLHPQQSFDSTRYSSPPPTPLVSPMATPSVTPIATPMLTPTDSPLESPL